MGANALFGGIWAQEYASDSLSAGNRPVVLSDDPFLSEIDSLLVCAYLNHFCYSEDTAFLNVSGFSYDEIPKIDEELVKERMERLNAQTPFNLVYNQDVANYIEVYGLRRRKMTSRVLGASEYYFPMFEEFLSQYDMPYELKYLAIVESALNPQAKSRAGAVGLWQFMYNTGKSYGLDITSYKDERMDPYKSTDAACRYLLRLHQLYDDWNLALAAYNSGPGNVNKAIRRSGGKKDYWAIRPWLPRETRDYVPAFIAVCYVMNNASDFNIYPELPRYSYFECDTVHVREQVKFDQLTAFTQCSKEDLIYLNPSYKRQVIPGEGINILRLPLGDVALFLQNEDSIYNFQKALAQTFEPEEEVVVYTVKSGDVLGKIADRHGVSVSNLMSWNNLRSNTIHPGQKLNIYVDPGYKKTSASNPAKPAAKPAGKYHVVKKGDTLWDIAKLYKEVTVDDLKRLNAGSNLNHLKPGQHIKLQ